MNKIKWIQHQTGMRAVERHKAGRGSAACEVAVLHSVLGQRPARVFMEVSLKSSHPYHFCLRLMIYLHCLHKVLRHKASHNWGLLTSPDSYHTPCPRNHASVAMICLHFWKTLRPFLSWCHCVCAVFSAGSSTLPLHRRKLVGTPSWVCLCPSQHPYSISCYIGVVCVWGGAPFQ